MAMILAVLVALPVFATPQRTDNDTTRGELASFDQFLDNRPRVGRELSRNPRLIDNTAYLSKHPGLKDYLEDHPRLREEVRENPSAFMSRERRFEGNKGKEVKPHAKRKRPDKDHDRKRR
jgi:hypothetical protein